MNDSEVSISPAERADAEGIAALCTRVQNGTTLPLTIWSCSGARQYVEDIIHGSRPEIRMRYYVLYIDRSLEGFICIRDVEGRVFVDNVFVSTRARKMQLAARFIAEATTTYLEGFPAVQVAWDVWEHERALRAWYRQLGGVEQSRRYWFRVAPKGCAAAGTVLQRPEEAAQHERYGFSMVEVVTAAGRHQVGLLDHHAFRVTHRSSLNDPEFLPTLASFGPERSVYLCSGEAAPPEGGEVVACSLRLHSPMEAFFTGLGRNIPAGEKRCTVSC